MRCFVRTLVRVLAGLAIAAFASACSENGGILLVPQSVRIESFTLISERALAPTVTESTYRARCRTDVGPFDDAVAFVSAPDLPVELIDATLRCGRLAKGATTTSVDTIVLHRDPARPFDPRALGWITLAWGPGTLVASQTDASGARQLRYEVEFTNGTGELQAVAAGVSSAAPGITLLDGLVVATAQRNGAVRMTDAFEVRVASGAALDPASLIWTLSVGARSEFALGAARTLDGFGQPLGDVAVEERGPAGLVLRSSEPISGLTTLAEQAGAFRWRFEKDGYLPVWREGTLAAGQVLFVPSPWLPRRSDERVSLSVLNGAELGDGDPAVVRFAGGAFATAGEGTLTAILPQSLPGLLPAGWSPLAAFWLELSAPPQESGSAALGLADRLAPGERAFLIRFDEATQRWIETGVPVTVSGDTAITSLAAAGAYAVVVPDSGATAPPTPIAAQPLAPTNTPFPLSDGLGAQATVIPPVAPASLDPVQITAQAEVVVTHPGSMPSGLVLRSDIDERYELRDGTSLTAPSYETFFTAYQRPGDDDAHTLHARFPLRPQVAVGPDELDEAVVQLEILPVSAFEGGFFDPKGGRVGTSGVTVAARPGAVTSPRAVELRSVDPARFGGLAPPGSVLLAFELAVDGLVPGARLGLGFGPQEPDTHFVVARFVQSGSRSGLEPRERFTSDAVGVLRTAEPVSGDRLPGVTGSGQYVLVRVDGPQALVQGVARDSAGQAAAGLAVEIEGEPWLTFSAAGGRFQVVATPGLAAVVATDLRNGDRGTASVLLADAASVGTVDLGTGPSGPRVAALDPAAGATGVRRSTPIQIVFSERVAPLASRDILLFDSEGLEVPAVLTMNLARTEATLLPLNPLDANETHRVVLEPSIADPGGLVLEGPREFGFTTVALADRGAGGQLISWEPGADTSACESVPGFDPDDTGISCVIGSAGAADPDVAVIVVNDTRGTTATVRAKVDGSFETFVDADVDDFLSATFVNGNGTSITLPLARQNFDDGSVALFPGGGILEAESDGGPVQVIVEPGSIPSKAKLKLDLADSAQILERLLAEAPPENGAQLLGALRLDVDGEIREAIDVAFPVDPVALHLPPGETPEQQDYAVAEPIEVDGDTVYRVLDIAHFEDGAIRTASPPFDGLFGHTGLLIALLFPPTARANVTVTGRVGSVSEALGRPPTSHEIVVGMAGSFPIRPVPGAIVSATPAGQALGGDRLRPGAFVATSNRAGFYALRASVVGSDDAVGVRATSPRFPSLLARTQFPVFAAEGLGAGGVVNAGLAFRVPAGSEGGIDTRPPVITPNPGVLVLPVGAPFEIPFVLRDDRTAPSLVSAVLLAEQSGSLVAGEELGPVDIDLGANDPTSPTTALGHVSIEVERAAVVTLLVTATDAAGNQTATPFSFRFGTDFANAPPGDLLPSDPDDATPPSVISIVPPDGALVDELDSIVVRFSEAVQDTFAQFGAISLISSAGGSIQPDYELSPDHLELRIDPGALLGGVEYTLTLGSAVRDLAGNALEDTATASFRTSATAGGALPDVKTPIATVMKGNVAYTLDRGTGQNDEAIYIHRIDDPEHPVLLGSFQKIPDYPRTLAIVPKWSYKQTLGGPTRADRTLLIAAGGLLGEDRPGQWIHVVDVTNPAAPERVASLLAIPDFTSAIALVRASAPQFYVLLNAAEGGTISQVNLQGFILGCNMSSAEFQANPHTPGLDANRDGDFVDVGDGTSDQLPIPERLTLFGIESTFLAPPFRLFTDFDVADGGSTVAAILDREKNPSAPAGSGAPPRYQTMLFGGSFLGDGTDESGGLEYATDPRPFRVRLDLDLPTTDAAGNTRIIPAALVVRGNDIEVIDLTDPANPVKIADVGFGGALADGKKIFALERSGSKWVVATDDKIFFLDRARLTQPPAQVGQPSPAITTAIDAAFSGRSFGASEGGVVIPGANRIAQLPPQLEVVQVVSKPVTDAIGISLSGTESIEDYVFGAGEASALLPAPLRASGDTPSVLSDPLVRQLHYYVRIRGSGAMGVAIPVAIEALDRNGKLLPAQGEFFPPIFLSSKATNVGLAPPLQRIDPLLTARRMSNDSSSALYNFYMSDPFVVVREAVTTADQQQFDAAGVSRRMIRSGEMIRVSVDAQDGASGILDALEGKAEDGVFKPGLSRTYTALCSDYVDSPNPSFDSAAPRVAGVTMSSGEYRHEAGDLAVPGRLQDLVLTRVYESRSSTTGPLGPGFDFNWNARICELPVTSVPAGYKLPLTDYGNPGADRVATAGDVLYVDGSGSVHLYRRIDALHGNLGDLALFANDPALVAFGWNGKIGSFYRSPSDRFDAMFRFTDGSFALLASDGTRTLFDGVGRLTDLIPPFVDGRMHLRYRQNGKLARVEGDRGIALEFGYRGPTTSPDFVNALDLPFSGPADLGRLARVKAGPKNVEYRYDDHGRLERVIKTHGRNMRYGWDAASPTLLASHGFGDGEGEPRAAIEYSEGLVIGVTVRGLELNFGGAVQTAAERFASNGGTAFAQIGDAPVQQYPFNRFGAATALAGAPVSADDEGRLEAVANVGVSGEMSYDDQNPVWRFRGNLLLAEREGFSTQMSYDGSAWNRLQSLTTPENVVTSYSFNPVDMTQVVSSGFQITQTRGPVVRKVQMNRNGQFVAESLEESGATAITRGVKHDASSDLPNSAVYGNTYPTATGSLFEIDVAASEGGPTSFSNGLQNFTVTRDSTGKATGLGGAASYSVTEDNGRPGGESFSSGAFSVEQSLTWASDDPFSVESMSDKVSGLDDQSTTYSYGANGQVGGWVTNGEATVIGNQGSVATTLQAPGISREFGGYASGLPTTLTDQGIEAQLRFDAFGRFESITTELGTTTLGYGSGHRVVSKSIVDPDFGTLFSESYGYDAAGRMSSITGAVDTQLGYFADGEIREIRVGGQTVRSVSRDESGRVTRIELPQLGARFERSGFDSSSARATGETLTFTTGRTITNGFAYDGSGRLQTQTLAGAGATTYGYDAMGRRTSTTDPDGVASGAAFAGDGTLLALHFGDGTSVDYHYDANRHLDGVGDIGLTLDAEKLVHVITWPDATTTQFNRTSNPFQVDEIEHGGVTQFLDRVAGQPRGISIPNSGDTLVYERDALGAIRSATHNGHSIDVGYDAAGRVTSETTLLGTWSLGFDAQGHLLTESYPSGFALAYAPDAQGQPTEIPAAGITGITFAAPGEVERFDYAGGVRLRRDFDAALRVTKVLFEIPNPDPAGEPNTIAGFEYGITPGGRVNFEHRLHDRRFDVFTRNAPSAGMRIIDFALGATSAAGANPEAELSGFSFDGDGELLSPASSAGAPDSRAFFPELFVVGQLQQADGVSILYDDGGAVFQTPLWVRLPGQGAVTRVVATLEHDGLGMLKRVVRDDGCTVEYERDAYGRIATRKVTGPAARCRAGKQRFAWQGQHLIEEYEETGSPFEPDLDLVGRYVWIGDRLALLQAASAPGAALVDFIPLANASNSVGGYLAPNGSWLESITYGPYGMPRFQSVAGGVPLPGEAETSTIASRLLFHGAFFDDATGLYQMGERTLHPLLGRFLERDSQLYRESRALLTAFNGDPASRTDATGALSEPNLETAGKVKAALTENVADAKSLGQTLLASSAKHDDWRSPFDIGTAATKMVSSAVTTASTIGGEEAWAKQAADYVKDVDVFAKGLAVAKSVFEIERETAILDATRAIAIRPSHAGYFGEMLQSGGGLAGLASLHGVGNSDAAAQASTLLRNEGAEAAAAHYYETVKDTQGNLIAGRLAATKGLLEFARAALKNQLEADKDASTTPIDAMDKSPMALTSSGLLDMSEGLLGGAEAALAAQKLMALSEAAKIASAVEGGSFLSRLLPEYAIAEGVFNASYKVTQGAILVLGDEHLGNAYRAAVRRFGEDGKLLTVASGMLAAAFDLTGIQFFQNEAWAVQNYQDRTPLPSQGPFVRELQANREGMNQIIRGLDVDSPAP